MTAGSARSVVTLGDIPATGHFPDAPALRGPALSSPDEVGPDFLDLVARNLPAGADGILVVYPTWQADPAKRLIRLTRGILDTDQVASVGLELPPLACSVVADLLSLAAPHLSIGHLAGLAVKLRDMVLSGARVATVARLEHIDTKLTQHMASYSPGSGFLAWATPQGRIDRVSRRRPITPPDFRPAGPLHLLIASNGADYSEFEKELSASLRPDSVKKVAAQPLGATFWGTRKHAEFVAFSAHPQALSDIVRSCRYWMCRWCRQPTALGVCAICGMFQEVGEPVSGRVREVVTAAAGATTGAPGVSPGPSQGSVSPGHGPALPAPPAFLTPELTAAQATAPEAATAQAAAPETTAAQAAPETVSPGGGPRPAEKAAPGPSAGASPSADPSPSGGSTADPGPGPGAQAGPHVVQSAGRSTIGRIARPGHRPDDDRAVPFGKGGKAADGENTAASGGRAPEHETTTRTPAGTPAPARHDQQEQQSP